MERSETKKPPNQALEPTIPGVTPRAEPKPRVAPPGIVAHLERWAKMSMLFHKSTDHAGWPEREIKMYASGFTVVEAGDPPGTRCTWADVLEVFAYKIDLFSYDEICIGFRFDVAGNYWWVGESYTGYKELIEELPRRFSGISTDWFSEVAHPAFATSRTNLWGEALTQLPSAVDAGYSHRKPWWRLWT